MRILVTNVCFFYSLLPNPGSCKSDISDNRIAAVWKKGMILETNVASIEIRMVMKCLMNGGYLLKRGLFILLHCKLQMGCMFIILYVLFSYYSEYKRFKKTCKFSLFDGMLMLGIVCMFFDGATAYTVNHLDSVNGLVNRVLHMFFLLSLDAFIFLLFLYMLSITAGFPKKKRRICFLCLPFLVNVLVVVINMPTLQYIQGEISNYSMGISAYTCFVMAGVYILLTMGIFLKRWKYIESHKRLSIFTYMMVLICITVYQMLHPQSLLSSLCVTIIVLGVYVNHENPTVKELSRYQSEMVMGFATLVENKDGSTGGHIKRTSLYVRLLAEELLRKGYYVDVLTKDYMKNLCKAAPMHDIGKISVPDMILQKPGKLTEEEFETIKRHTVDGGKIIQQTFGHLENDQYAEMAYAVARYHHEKWNGKGYPEGLKMMEIPLCARIMAIADVFDAVSQSRCYRNAMPLEQCFNIILEGSGKDFEPILVEVFLEIKDKVKEVYKQIDDEQ